MAAPFTDSQATTLNYNSVEYFCTSIVRNAEGAGDLTDQRVDVSTLDLASGSCRVYQDPPLKDCGTGGADGTITFQVDFYGTEEPQLNQSLDLVIKQTISGAEGEIYNGKATCTSASTTWATGEVVTGSATFAVDE